MSYIIFVNPTILSQAGIDRHAAFVTTVMMTGLATIGCGLIARLPFAIAPGMEMNSFVALYVVATLGFTWQAALGIVFWSGILFVIISASGMRRRVIEAIPDGMRSTLTAIVGTFILLVGLRISGAIDYGPDGFIRPGYLLTPEMFLLCCGFGLILVFRKFGSRMGVAASVLLASAVLRYVSPPDPGAAETHAGAGAIAETFGRLDVSVILSPASWSLVLVLLLIDFYGSAAKLLAISRNTLDGPDGRVPGLGAALIVDSSATVAGAVAGTSNLTVFVESAVGVAAGARTGLAAVVCGICILICLVLAPVVSFIPASAAGGALAYVAYTLLPGRKELAASDWWERATLPVCLIVVVATFSIEAAFLAAALGHLGREAFVRRRANPMLAASALLIAFGLIIQHGG